ncbi:MAG: sulfur carrier protein ThiS [Gammaproteobacteria bacterium]
MQVIINGDKTTVNGIRNVAGLINYLELTGRIAVEINQQIVPRSQFEKYPVNEGDVIEIVFAIGGG